MSGDTILRQWALLKAVPRYRKATAQELQQQLAQQGFNISERSVQRDLIKLSRIFPIEADERNRPYGWRYARDAQAMDVPSMDMPTALTFKLAQAFLEPLMPPTTLDALSPHMRRAEQVLTEANVPLRQWPEKVRFLPRGQPLIPPDVCSEVLEVVYQSLLEEHRFRAVYRARGSDKASEYLVNPLGLVYRNGLIYLVCTLFDYTDLRQLVLHRMESAEPLPEQGVTVPEGFSLDSYIRNNAFDVPAGETLVLEVLFEPEAAAHLYELKVSEDQQLSRASDDRVRLTATVADTLQLRWWLKGFGAQVEVLGPPELRDEFADEAAKLLRRYEAEEA